MGPKIIKGKEYKEFLNEIKNKVRHSRIKAALSVNAELLELYWDMGKMITGKQSKSKWGDGIIFQLSRDLMIEFPEMKGFSLSNLKYIRKWYLLYSQSISKGQQLVGLLNPSAKSQQAVGLLPKPSKPKRGDHKEVVSQLVKMIPWGHHIQIITKCKDVQEALFYVANTNEHNWSRNVLAHQIESNLYKRQGKAVTNFHFTLPKHQSDLAREMLKNPYNFDFLSLGRNAEERELEAALTEHITKFLLELGAGFAFMGRQYHVEVGDSDFYIDLLFYHTKLRCYVVVELKTGEFVPEYAGKLNFYLSVVDDKLKSEHEQPSIGILICKGKNKMVAEYSLKDVKKPIGITEYKLTETIPKKLKGSLPSIEELEKEFRSRVSEKNNKAGRRKTPEKTKR
jgi:predicted nuclease of restriction endonuclease-like (RecB) superfamily